MLEKVEKTKSLVKNIYKAKRFALILSLLFLNKKNKISEFDTVKTVLTESLPVLEGIESFDNDTLFASLSPLSEKLALKLGAIMWCLRIAVSGMAATPGGATEIMEVIGKEATVNRIKEALAKI